MPRDGTPAAKPPASHAIRRHTDPSPRRPPCNGSPDVSVKRPVFATVLMLAICVVGFAGYPQLGVDRFPKVDFPIVTRHHAPARRRARGGRDRDHRQDRGGGQHHQRHRRAALDLDRGRLAGLHHLHAREEHRRRRAGGARPASTSSCRDLPEGHRAARSSASSIPTPRPSSTSPLDGRPAHPRGHRVRRQASCAGSSRASPASARCCVVGGRKRQINVWLDPLKLRAVGPDRRRRAARDRRAEPAACPAARSRRGRRSSRCACTGRVASRRGARRASCVRQQRRPRRCASRDVARVEDGEEEAETLAARDGERARRALGAQAVRHEHRRGRRRACASASAEVAAARCPPGYKLEVVRDNSRGHPHQRRRRARSTWCSARSSPRSSCCSSSATCAARIIAALAIPISHHRHLRADVVAGLHAQHHHAARARARGRHRHRRRHRRAREHLPLRRREGHDAAARRRSRPPRRSASRCSRPRCR